MMRRPILRCAVTALVAVAPFFASACGSHAAPAPSSGGGPAVTVQVADASVRDLATAFEVGGELRAREQAAIASRIMATVVSVKVTAGDRVRAGQPLVVLDGRDLDAGRAQARAGLAGAQEAARVAAAERQAAQAALALASATHRRIADLRSRNSATPHELDEAQASLQAAEARVKSTEAQAAQAAAGIEAAQAAATGSSVAASFAILTAPFDGLVTQKLVEPGNMASPGVPLLTVEDTRAFRLEVRIDESRASRVPVGAEAEVTMDGPAGEPVRAAGRVSEIARVLDPGAHAFLAKIELPSAQGLRSGTFARARFSGPTDRAIAIPAASLVRRGQLTSVFVVDGAGIAHLRLVTVGEPLSGFVEVRAGLDAGERVVVAPPVTLVDGSRVRVGGAR